MKKKQLNMHRIKKVTSGHACKTSYYVFKNLPLCSFHGYILGAETRTNQNKFDDKL